MTPVTRKLALYLSAFALSVGFCQAELDPAERYAGAPMPAPPMPAPAPNAPAAGGGGAGTARPAVDLTPRTLARIPVGTVIGRGAPDGWTHLVLFATPTLSAEDLRDAPKMAADYARMFKFTLLADVRRAGDGPYYLRALGRGFAIGIRGRETVIDSNNTRGADLGLFGARILGENERILDQDVNQVARTSSMLVFDAKTVMRVGTEHIKRVMRHAIVVAPDTGRLATFVWLLADDGRGGYEAAESAVQLLPPDMHEARYLSVKRDRFTLGIPSPDAFALIRIPQGTPVPYTPAVQRLATLKTFTPDQVLELEAAFRAAAFGAGR
jgi:hypothetical protein